MWWTKLNWRRWVHKMSNNRLFYYEKNKLFSSSLLFLPSIRFASELSHLYFENILAVHRLAFSSSNYNTILVRYDPAHTVSYAIWLIVKRWNDDTDEADDENVCNEARLNSIDAHNLFWRKSNEWTLGESDNRWITWRANERENAKQFNNNFWWCDSDKICRQNNNI